MARCGPLPYDYRINAINTAASFGRVLRHLRGQAHLSQERLAHECGLTPNYISLLERGLRTPTLDTVWAVCTRLGVHPSELVAQVEADMERQAQQVLPEDT